MKIKLPDNIELSRLVDLTPGTEYEFRRDIDSPVYGYIKDNAGDTRYIKLEECSQICDKDWVIVGEEQ